MVFMMANYTGPWGIRFNPFLIAQSGKPYNIITPTDLTGDNFFNRPSIVCHRSLLACTNSGDVQTSFGCLNTTPACGDTLIPVNLGNGPAAVAVNLRISRALASDPNCIRNTSQAAAACGRPPLAVWRRRRTRRPCGGGAEARGGLGGPGGPGGGGTTAPATSTR